MPKRNIIIYWVATLWVALAMASSGIIQLLQLKFEVEYMAALGYPAYFLSILGFWKLLGTVAILAPKYPVAKEWAYAGFFVTMTGAIVSHVSSGDTVVEMIPAALLVVLIVTSWYFRPASRKVAELNK